MHLKIRTFDFNDLIVFEPFESPVMMMVFFIIIIYQQLLYWLLIKTELHSLFREFMFNSTAARASEFTFLRDSALQIRIKKSGQFCLLFYFQ